ncbi:MAG: glucose-6-phosphate isomerase [Gaiellaceae bacterium]|jgi:transaldolase / glucose-6-phosphate isomerase
MVVASQQELVERIWSRDPTVWTDAGEEKWLGWLDEPKRMQERLADLREFAEQARTRFDTFVLLGMGGSSLAPEVLKRTFGVQSLHVLDTTHPAMLRHAAGFLDLEKTMFIVSSKSGTTLETRSHFDYYWERAGGNGDQFVAVTDPGSELEQVAHERGMRAFAGEPTIGGRYSALSAFGLVPGALMGLDLERILGGAVRMAEACRGDDGPGLQLGLRLGEAWQNGRDKVCITETEGRFGLWAEQLIAESTGKQGKGLVPAPGESPNGPDRQPGDVELSEPHDIGAEFFRWEFAVAVAGAILQINPFDQPNVQAAKDKTKEVLASGEDPQLEQEGSLDELLAAAEPPNYVAIQAFIDPMRERELEPLITRARETGCVVTHGLGPRYLHSTGQLHKGGPPTGLFVQVVDDTGAEIPIPGQEFGFGRLIRAQAEGDFRSLRDLGRKIVRVRI